jgi:type I site-specific restriction endonuclease
MNKKRLSERDICTKFITPALEKAGWNVQTQIREEFPLTNGRVIVRGKLHTRGKNKRADYVLFYKPNIPITVLEAKDNNHSVGDGMQQALEYADLLQVPFVFSCNGDRLLFHNKINTERAREVRQRNYFTKYGDLAQRVLDALLEKYADEGIEAIEEPQILKIAPFTEMGTPIELVQDFGGIQGYQDAIGELERELYRA